MKKLALVTLVVLFGGLVAQAAEHPDVLLDNVRTANLQVASNILGLSVSYPGKDFSQICGVEIRADNYNGHMHINKFFDAIKIVGRIGQDPDAIKVLNTTTIDIDFSGHNGSYGVWFNVETKDGSSLKETIKRTLGENRRVIAVTKTCQ